MVNAKKQSQQPQLSLQQKGQILETAQQQQQKLSDLQVKY